MDGKFIVSTSDDGTVIIWDSNGNVVRTLQSGIGSLDRLALSSDSRLIAIGADNGVSQVWSVQGQLLYILKRHMSSIREILFGRNNDMIMHLQMLLPGSGI